MFTSGRNADDKVFLVDGGETVECRKMQISLCGVSCLRRENAFGLERMQMKLEVELVGKKGSYLQKIFRIG